ncbi:Rrf2 family transcriptional regulator [Neptunicella marina]|uniref:Rrf2 family transcriptional regulator n=1 Tax=Neptunicella marina TaxID=2125989 RepID=A0A8J6LYF6_9ALTE|nr:Rrf2 family transcriptional regulator [Neptunicella marina]MBC3766164.1 Rrf2 family transcriptional regulator [Neptunicella marina]
MRKNSQLSRVLHILVHLNKSDQPITSAAFANMLKTNAVVVRRIMGMLRNAGYVLSTNGRNGGWVLNKPLDNISLLDIHQALGESTLFNIALTDEHQHCPIEKSVNRELQDVLQEVEALVLQKFSAISLDKIANH